MVSSSNAASSYQESERHRPHPLDLGPYNHRHAESSSRPRLHQANGMRSRGYSASSQTSFGPQRVNMRHGHTASPSFEMRASNQGYSSQSSQSSQHRREGDGELASITPLDDNELYEVISRSSELRSADAWSTQMNMSSASKKEDISPWLYQSSETWTPAPRSRTRTDPDGGSSSLYSVDRVGLRPSTSTLSLQRRTTPPSASTSTSTLGGSGVQKDTPPSLGKKSSKNPFKFLKKKASSIHSSRDHGDLDSASSSSSAHRTNQHPLPPLPLRPAAWLETGGPSRPNTSAASGSSMRGPPTPGITSGFAPPAFNPNPWERALPPLPLSATMPVQSLEDEFDAEIRAEQLRKEKRKIRGVIPHHRTRDRTKTHDDGETARDAKPVPPEEVELSLDTNFDQIDDIVDTSRSRQVGPMDEPMPSMPSSPRHPAGSSSSMISIEGYPARDSSTSYASTAEQRQPSFASTWGGSSSQSSEPAMRTSTRSGRLPYVPSSPSSSTSFGLDGRQPQGTPHRPGLRRISLVEAQQHQQLRRVSSTLRDVHEQSSPDGAPRRGSTGGADSKKDSQGSAMDYASIRKGSVTSAHSLRSAHSGISPKTSFVQLPHVKTDPAGGAGSRLAGGGWAPGAQMPDGSRDIGYHFPPPVDDAAGAASLLAVRKSSASSAGQAASSSWMAPDSWAVQPDQTRDVLRDDQVEEDDDDDDLAETGSASRTKRGSSSNTSVLTSSGIMHRPGSTDPLAYAPPSKAGSRRGTEEAIDPIPTPLSRKQAFGDAGGGGETVEVLEVSPPPLATMLPRSHTLSGAHPPPSSSARPSSRGGTLAAVGASAAAAAAGKLGLHRPSRHRLLSNRPNTAGSLGTQRPSLTTIGSTRNLTADDDNMVHNIIKRDIAPVKRPGTAGSTHPHSGHPGSGKSHFLRVYKMDHSFITLACSLTYTASEVRTILARKSLTNDSGAFRLFVRDKGSERPLGGSDKPAQLQRRRLLQAGYTEADGLEEMGRDDLSYLLRFVFRPDSVPTFDSEAFGNNEHTFQHLDLQSRNLEMVPIFLYRHADWIVSLDLSGNPMSDLPLDFVQLCSNLRILRLSNLALKRIPQSIKSSETLTHLDVSNNRIAELAHISLDSIPELMSLKVQNNRLFELPPFFGAITTLRHLNISNNRFEQFPAVICDATSLMDLDISFNSIAVLPPQIVKLVRLERFILVGNSLEALPEGMGKLVSLRTIDLRRNLVQDISVLFGLPRLQVVQAESNSIKAFDATLGPQLRTIELSRNPLSKVKIAAFTSCDLTSLDLSSTNMTRLEESLFPQLPALAHLTLDRNQFVVLPDTIGDLAKLEVLSCNTNLLSTLPETLGRLTRLRELHVHNNNLKMLPSSIWRCERLESINVSSNLLENFPDVPTEPSTDPALKAGDEAILAGRKGSAGSATAYQALQRSRAAAGGPVRPLAASLRKLRLGDNRLTDDVFSVLSLLPQLEVLNLSFNEIFEIPHFSLSKLKKLREFYISGNHLSSIPSDDLEHLQELRILHLNGNKLQTLPAELGRMGKLVNLDVGNNVLKYNIANWHYDWNWNSNLELRYLNLSGNKRLEIKSTLPDHSGKRTSISDFSRLTCLRLLGLMDVTMPLHSNSTPDESDNRRVRTSLSQINNMAYGIADALGKHDNLSIVDVVIPRFGKEDSQCVFGLFDGRGHGPHVGSRIARHLAEWSEYRISWEIQRLGKLLSEPEDIPTVLRRAFLRMQKDYADILINDGSRKLSEAHAEAAADESRSSAPAIAAASNKHDWRAGASAVLAYIIDKTMYIANAGDALAVLSRNGGTAHLVSTRHEPFSREETERIRSAEGWVSLRGYVNDSLDVSRSFGYYHLFPIVNAAPAVTMVQLTDSDEFVILANRVLWQYVSYQTAVDIARTERNDPMIASQKLRDFAISYGAEESIMVMVVSVGDLFFNRQQRNGRGLVHIQPASEAIKHSNRRLREELPGDRTLARLDREVAPPIGQVALVFTDIKNSTALWETNGGMQTAMRQHNYLLRRQLRTIGGYEVKTEGDAFMVSFPSVTSALLWCFTVQLQLQEEDWPQEILECDDGREVYDAAGQLIHRGLSVRMGIHWGWPVCEADPITRRMDYFGPMVNRSARICGAADGGQIMASKDVITELRDILGTFNDAAAANAGGDDLVALPPTLAADIKNHEIDEDTFRLLNPNVSRDVVLLRRMGFGISEIGERRLKGLETPEVLSLIYPKQLAGRLQDTKTNAPAAQVYEPTVKLLDVNEIKQVGILCLRLEFLASQIVFPALVMKANGSGIDVRQSIQRPYDAATISAAAAASQEPGAAPSLATVSPSARRKIVETVLEMNPEMMACNMRDDGTDQELYALLEQFTMRITNAISTLTLNLVRQRAAETNGSTTKMDVGDLNMLLRLIGPLDVAPSISPSSATNPVNLPASTM
ncbi:cysteinyl-tRNA synthetase [Thecaphora frezii]